MKHQFVNQHYRQRSLHSLAQQCLQSSGIKSISLLMHRGSHCGIGSGSCAVSSLACMYLRRWIGWWRNRRKLGAQAVIVTRGRQLVEGFGAPVIGVIVTVLVVVVVVPLIMGLRVGMRPHRERKDRVLQLLRLLRPHRERKESVILLRRLLRWLEVLLYMLM